MQFLVCVSHGVPIRLLFSQNPYADGNKTSMNDIQPASVKKKKGYMEAQLSSLYLHPWV